MNKLTPAERLSTTWVSLKAQLVDRQMTLRSKLEGDVDERKTQRLRGALSELKAIIALGDEAPTVPDEGTEE